MSLGLLGLYLIRRDLTYGNITTYNRTIFIRLIRAANPVEHRQEFNLYFSDLTPYHQAGSHI